MVTRSSLQIAAVPALQDNYIWIIHDGDRAAAVDPGDSGPVLSFLETQHLRLMAILCTHRHRDHTAGIPELREVYNVPVYGRRHPGNPHITHDLHEGDHLLLDAMGTGHGAAFEIIEIPGHLDDHIAYIAASMSPGILFCGDVLFGAGCGRNFEGTLAQLHDSLKRLARLPGDTLVYCAHEYTEANLRFALACEPGNAQVQQRIAAARQLQEANQPTLPSTITLERATNPFLRCTQPEIIRTLQQRGLADTSELGVFAALRAWRSQF